MALRCTRSFSSYLPGSSVPRVVKVGQVVADDDPTAKKFSANFESVDTHLASQRPAQAPFRRVEQATADPGQPRDLTPPAATASKGDGGRKPPARRGRGSGK